MLGILLHGLEKPYIYNATSWSRFPYKIRKTSAFNSELIKITSWSFDFVDKLIHSQYDGGGALWSRRRQRFVESTAAPIWASTKAVLISLVKCEIGGQDERQKNIFVRWDWIWERVDERRQWEQLFQLRLISVTKLYRKEKIIS